MWSERRKPLCIGIIRRPLRMYRFDAAARRVAVEVLSYPDRKRIFPWQCMTRDACQPSPIRLSTLLEIDRFGPVRVHGQEGDVSVACTIARMRDDVNSRRRSMDCRT